MHKPVFDIIIKGMELLTEISNSIDLLKQNADEMDASEVIRVLSLAYEVGRDGLSRSQNASLYLKLKPQLEQFEALIPELRKTITSHEESLKVAQKELDAFKGVLSAMRKDIAGKTELVSGYSKERKLDLKKEIESCTIGEMLKIRTQVLSDFNGEWKPDDTSDKLTEKTPYINPKLYQTGA